MKPSSLSVYLIEIRPEDGLGLDAFSTSEKAEILRFSRMNDRYLKACSIMLKSKFVPGEIKHNAFGKPYAIISPSFSVSHSYPYVVIALSECGIGVDIEPIRPFSEKLLNHCFSPGELGSGVEPTLLWSLKEACYKVKGDRPFDPKGMETVIENDGKVLFEGQQYWYRFFPLREFAFVIVSETDIGSPTIERIAYCDLAKERKPL